MSINVSSYSSISTRKGVSGLMSGLDTDEIVKNLTSATRTKITKALQDKQILSWKQSAYQDITTDLSDLYAKYFRFSSSSDSVMNRNFFKSTSISSSSDYVTATGSNDAIENVIIKDIQSLAKKTSLASSHTISNQSLDSTSMIYDSWQDNNMAKERLKINYDGKDYVLKVDSDFYLDSSLSDSEKIDGLVAQLNKQIDKNEDLKGKIAFGLESDGALSLSETSGTSGDLKVTDGTSYILSATGLYNPGVSNVGSTKVKGAYKLEAQELYKKNIFAGATVEFDIDGVKGNIKIDSNFNFSKAALEKDSSGNYTDDAKTRQKNELSNAFNAAINKNSNIKGKIKVSIDGTDDLAVKFEAVEDDGKLKILGGDEKVLNNLGITPASNSDVGTKTVTGNINVNDIYQVETKQLNEVLAGTSLTFNFNGIDKKIEFKESEKDQYSDAAGLKDYIQNKLDEKIGSGKVTVSESAGKLSFITTDSSHIIRVSKSSAKGVLEKNGALHLSTNGSNRVDFNKTLDELGEDLTTPLTADADGNYKISINGKELSFSGNTTLGNVISKINSDKDMGITISYSEVSDKFSVMAKESGVDNKIDISDVGSSNFSQVLFGTKDDPTDGYTVVAGEDFTASISFDGGNTYLDVNRQSNSFKMDGVSFEFNGKADGAEEENVKFKTNNNIDETIDKITKFVDTYNKIVEKIQKKVREKRYGVAYDSDDKYPPLTDEQKENMSDKDIEKWEEKAQLGLLQNDSTLEGILYKMRSAMSTYVEGEGALYELGITTGDYKLGGTLIIDEDKLRSVLATEPDKVTKIFTSENGVSERLNSVLKDAVVGDIKHQGTLISLAGKKTSSTNSNNLIGKQIKQYKISLKSLKKKLKLEEKKWYNKFTRLEVLVGKLNSQSDYFSSMMQG